MIRTFFSAIIDGKNAIVTAYTKNDSHFVCVQICTDNWTPGEYYLDKSSPDESVAKDYVKDEYGVDVI